MFGMDNTGRFLGPALGGFIVTWLGVRAPFAVYGALALLALIPAFMFTKDTPRVARESGPAEESRLTITQIVRPRIVYFVVAFCAALTRGPAQASLLFLYASFAYHMKPTDLGFLAASAGAIALPVGFIAGSLMDRFGRKRTMVPGFSGVTVTMVGLAMTAFFHLGLTVFIAILLLGYLMQSMTGGSIQTVGADVAPPEARGRFLGLWRFTGQGGTALSPLVFAALAAGVDYGAAFLFVAASAASVTLVLIFKVPETGAVPTKVARGMPIAETPVEAPI
jgi:MFS family permease